MELQRVIVIGLPGVVGDMIEAAVEAQPGMLLVRHPDATDPRLAIGYSEPHVLVVGTADDRLPPPWLDALHARPGLRVVTVDPVHGTGVLYEMRPHAVALGDVAPVDIVAAIQRGRCEPLVG